MVLTLKGILALVLAHLLLLYVPITAIGLGSLLVVEGVGVFLAHKNLFALVCAAVLLSVALEVTVRWLAPTSMQPYYRPHEKLVLEKTYRPQPESSCGGSTWRSSSDRSNASSGSCATSRGSFCYGFSWV